MFARIGLVKERGNAAFKRNIMSCVLVSLVIVVLTSVFDLFIANIVQSSESRYEAFYKRDFYRQVLNLVKTAPIVDIMTKAFRFVLPILLTMGLSFCLQILFTNPLAVSYTRFFMENGVTNIEGKKMFFVFKNGRYPTVAWKMFLREIYIFGWTLLFVIPGIMKSFSYRMVPYILAENPDLDRKRVFEISEQMMKGHRWESFVLELSFIGWIILGYVTYGITNVFYANPYMQASYAEFYFNLKEEAQKNNVFKQDELPTFEVKKGKVQMV